MKRQFEAKNCNYLYKKMLLDLFSNGKEISPRGLTTKEFFPCLTIIKEPRERFLSCFSGVINPFFLIAEAIWIFSGRGDEEWITKYCKSLGKYADKGFDDYNGAYGIRLRKWGQNRERRYFKNDIGFYNIPFDQVYDIINKLKKDNNTRQAIATLHIPPFDSHLVNTLDRPCNVISMFKIRDNKLHLHQILRSNDINKGLFPTNVFQWSFILECIASELKIDVGELLFFSDSLHMYVNDKITEKVIKDKRKIDIYEFIRPTKITTSLRDTDEIIKSIMQETDDIIKDNFWQSVFYMLKIYRLRLQDKKIEAIKLTKNVLAEDMRVMAYNFHWNKKKTDEEKTLIINETRNYIYELKSFIME